MTRDHTRLPEITREAMVPGGDRPPRVRGAATSPSPSLSLPPSLPLSPRRRGLPRVRHSLRRRGARRDPGPRRAGRGRRARRGDGGAGDADRRQRGAARSARAGEGCRPRLGVRLQRKDAAVRGPAEGKPARASPAAQAPSRSLLGACLQAGVCDPASVTTWALENAASITGSMLTTEVRRGEVGRCGQMWADMGRCGQMWGDAHHRDVGRWGDVGRCSPPRCGEGERGRCGEGERGRRERGERGGEMRASLPGSPPLLDVASALDVF